MSSLVAFDQQGAFGPAISVLFNTPNLNQKGIKDLTEVLKNNFMKLSKREISGDKEFVAAVIERNLLQSPMSPTEIIATKFFQSMQAKDIDSDSHRKVMKQIIPDMMKSAKGYVPQLDMEDLALKAWLAGFVECWLTEDQIHKHCEVQGSCAARFMDERIRIGKDMYALTQQREFSEKDLDALIAIARTALAISKEGTHCNNVLQLTGDYLKLFAMIKEKPQDAGNEVIGLLHSAFRQKMFTPTK